MEKTCTRRNLFKLLAADVGNFVLDAMGRRVIQSAPASVNYVRPPGSANESDFLSKCTNCDDCIKACPEMAIRKASPEMGRRIAGTPIIIPKENPCKMCEGYPCISACNQGALAMSDKIRIGTAVIDPKKCYLSQGQPCDYCRKYCPTKPKAIETTLGKPPLVDAEICTGCGECAQICPTEAICIQR